MLEHTKLVDVVKSVQICFDPNDRNTTIVDDSLLMEQYYEFEEMMEECMETEFDKTVQKSKWILRMEMDAEALLDKNITMDDIHFAISNGHGTDISCIYSDYNAGNLVFRIRLNSSVFNKTKKQKGIADTLDQSDEIYMLRNFQEALLNNIVLRGVEGIRNVLPRKLQNNVLKDEGKFIQKDVWILDTTGTNLMEVMALDFIDGYRTFSNDIKEIFDVLGIEAARQTIRRHGDFNHKTVLILGDDLLGETSVLPLPKRSGKNRSLNDLVSGLFVDSIPVLQLPVFQNGLILPSRWNGNGIEPAQE
jgi:DNA-directed RNA polymerase II subunit RPB1